MVRKKEQYPGQELMFNWNLTNVDLNNLDDDILLKIPPTDSRLRPDQRAYEFGDTKLSQAMKIDIEEKQRERRRYRNTKNVDHIPKWFEEYRDHDSGDMAWGYKGGYWERRFHYYKRNCKEIGIDVPEKGSSETFCIILENEWFPRSLTAASGLKLRNQKKFLNSEEEDSDLGLLAEEQKILEEELLQIENNQVIWPKEIVGIFN